MHSLLRYAIFFSHAKYQIQVCPLQIYDIKRSLIIRKNPCPSVRRRAVPTDGLNLSAKLVSTVAVR
jgi:hypothetical protein